MKRNFREMLEAKWAEGKFVCVGLDSELGKIPQCVKDAWSTKADRITGFNQSIVRATKDIALAYKPNLKFYIAHGDEGIQALWRTCNIIHDEAPVVPIILDAKDMDIGNTNVGSVQFAFEYLKADAITVNPYLGCEAAEPFLECKDKGIIVLCRTSNPGAGEFQDPYVSLRPGYNLPFYQYVAWHVANGWNKNDNCSLVVGATYTNELAEVRKIVGDMPILIPAIGAQGGDLEKTVKAGKDSRGKGMIINSSRGIIFASKDSNFANAARLETMKLNDSINQYLT